MTQRRHQPDVRAFHQDEAGNRWIYYVWLPEARRWSKDLDRLAALKFLQERRGMTENQAGNKLMLARRQTKRNMQRR